MQFPHPPTALAPYDQHIFSEFEWQACSALPPKMAELMEAMVLMEFCVKISPKCEVTFEDCRRCLEADQELRSLFLHCWETGSFAALERHERFPLLLAKSLRKIGRSTTNLGSQGYIMSNTGGVHSTTEAETARNAVKIFENSSHVNVFNSSVIGVAGDYWQLTYLSDRHREIATWYASVDHRLTHNSVSKKRAPETGLWFLDSEEFNKWYLNSESRILWCPGIPGVGKTVMASVAINHLRQTNDPQTAIGFIYFDYRTQNHQSLHTTLECLCRQMYETSQGTPRAQPLEELYKCHEHRASRPLCHELQKALCEVMCNPGHSYIVIDALDEYQERYQDARNQELVNSLLELSPTVKLLITSRTIGDMKALFRRPDCIKRPITTTEGDIKLYLEGKISVGSLRIMPTPTLEHEIVDAVQKAAKGRFLVAELLLQSLSDLFNPGDVRKALKKFPHKIDGVYDDTMQRIKKKPRTEEELALHALMWVTCSYRPLSVRELQHGLAMYSAGEDEEIEDFVVDPSHITAACAGLVVISEETQILSLVHFTAQDYFVKHRNKYFPDADEHLAKTCLRYIKLSRFGANAHVCCQTFWKIHSWTHVVAHPAGQCHAFYNYAALSWGFHANRSRGSLQAAVRDFLEEEGSHAVATNMNYVARAISHCTWDITHDSLPDGSAIFLAVYHGQWEAASALLQSRAEPPLTPEGHTLFAFIIKLSEVESPATTSLDSNGYKDLMEKLLKGANPTKLGGPTPLWLAIQHKQVAAVKILLDQPDIDINPRDDRGNTPLTWAARRGHLPTVSLLLDHPRIDVNPQNNEGVTPLMFAASNGHDTIAAAMLNHPDIQVNLRDSECRTALIYAARQKQEGVVELLLAQRDVDVNSQHDNGRTALSWALDFKDPWRLRNPEKIVELLLGRSDIDVNLPNSWGDTPLDYAIRNNHHKAVKLLQARGAECTLTPIEVKKRRRLLEGRDQRRVKKQRLNTAVS